MADPYYSVLIQLGDPAVEDQSWTVTHTGDPYAADSLTPIEGLRFGWAMPDAVLWPVKPSPMAAAFAFNVPAFADLEWVGEDVPVAIEVKLHASAAVAFSFYGRITDAQAVPRRGRTGVTLSCVALDYTVDLTRDIYTVIAPDFDTETEVLAAVWASNPTYFGDFPDWPLAITLDTEVETTEFIGKFYSEIVDATLAQAITGSIAVPSTLGGGFDGALVLLAPNIDPATRLPDTTQAWAFDLAYRHAHREETLAAALLDKASVKFGRNKRKGVDSITVTGADGTDAHADAVFGADYLPTVTRLNVQSISAVRIQDIADFYVRDDARTRRGWNVTTLRYLLDQIDPAVFAATFPPDLMPRWAETPGDPTRATCYGILLELTGVPADANPYAADPDPALFGLLSGAEFSIAGGRPSLSLSFRELQAEVTPFFTAGSFARSGYGIAPYGALTPVPA